MFSPDTAYCDHLYAIVTLAKEPDASPKLKKKFCLVRNRLNNHNHVSNMRWDTSDGYNCPVPSRPEALWSAPVGDGISNKMYTG